MNGKGMPADWATYIGVTIYEGQGDIMNSVICRAIKLVEHALKIMQKVLEKICNDR